jgi:hypothetical protein
MTTPADFVFMQAAATAVARAGRTRVRPLIKSGVGSGFGSTHLSRNVEIRAAARTQRTAGSRIYLDHYWARFVHDGRGKMSGPPRDSQFYVWYKDRKEDPRLSASGGYPRRFREVRKLTKEEFIADKKAGKLVWVDMRLGAGRVHSGVAPSPFFSNDSGGGMKGFSKTAGSIVAPRWSTYLTTKRLKKYLHIRKTVTITL